MLVGLGTPMIDSLSTGREIVAALDYHRANGKEGLEKGTHCTHWCARKPARRPYI